MPDVESALRHLAVVTSSMPVNATAYRRPS